MFIVGGFDSYLVVKRLDWCCDWLWQNNYYITHDETPAEIICLCTVQKQLWIPHSSEIEK
jgi:hypothetical protein